MSDAKPKFELWPYNPSIAGGVLSVIVFASLAGIHAFRLVKHRTWFCVPFVIGGLFEAVGYAGRAAAHNNLETTTPYIIQSILILVAPILFAASIYMILGRLILRTDSGSLCIVRPTWVTKLFVSGDIFCFLIQSGGAGMLVQAADADAVSRGENIILLGLVVQILIFGFFVVVAGIWHRRLQQRSTAASMAIPWNTYILYLYAASGFITIRNACRAVEYATGKNGFLLTHEWCLYLYDCVPMLLTLVVCITWYDPNIQPNCRRTDMEMGTWS